MKTQCISESLAFHPLNQRAIRGDFNGSAISSDGGAYDKSKRKPKDHKLLEMA